jgi:peptidoglycan hydrolase CwlO-like protein
MATIVIDRDTLQDHIDMECSIKVTSFCWSEYNGVTDVECDTRVKEDLTYEDDSFVTLEEYSDMENTCKQVMEELEETSAKIKELTDKVNELNKQLDSHKVWYKFWK